MAIDQQLVRPFSGLELLARQVVEGFITGLHKSPFHGFSVEFAEHRLYNTGESTRHIDWKLFGRTDKLFVKRYEEETNLRCQIILDDSSSMYFPPTVDLAPGTFNKISFSVHCAAALTELLRRQRDAVGLSVFSEEVELHTPSRSGQLHIRMIYHELEKVLAAVSDRRKTFAIKALHQIADAVHRRSLVMIFSDMFESSEHTEELFSALQHLRHNKHEVVLFHVTDKKRELDFEYEKRPYRFIDTETGEEVRANPAEVKENYIRSMQAFRKQLKLHAAQYRIDLVEADIHDGFNQVLMTYLQKRLRM
ncbi:MAG: DUF58 domain-containing protein [Bacteroidia bacterium]|nr:DUF58 domain-containing protein [Bacteroidia bacterium]